MPVKALTTTITNAVTNVSFRECHANGSRNASQNAPGPGLAGLHEQDREGKTTISPR